MEPLIDLALEGFSDDEDDMIEEGIRFIPKK